MSSLKHIKAEKWKKRQNWNKNQGVGQGEEKGKGIKRFAADVNAVTTNYTVDLTAGLTQYLRMGLIGTSTASGASGSKLRTGHITCPTRWGVCGTVGG
jgi:hypothetical protein